MAKMATREAYGKALAELAKENKKILVLEAPLQCLQPDVRLSRFVTPSVIRT